MPASTRKPFPAIRYHGPLYRALNPVWARQPLSGDGARRFGGRFNPKGMAALYTATSVLGAVGEANQLGRPFEPVTLVEYAADIFPVFDAADPAALRAWKVTAKALADDSWRDQMRAGKTPPGQALALRLVAAGFAGALVKSYARGAPADRRNLVLWHWGGDLPARLILTDTEGRLSP